MQRYKKKREKLSQSDSFSRLTALFKNYKVIISYVEVSRHDTLPSTILAYS